MDHFKSLYWICYNVASVLCLVFWNWGLCDFSFPTINQSSTPCTGRWGPNHGACREVPKFTLKVSLQTQAAGGLWRRGCGWRVTHRVLLGYSGSVNWCSHCGKQHGGFSKTKTRTTIWSRSQTSGYLSEKYMNSNSKRYTHPSVHSSITYNCQGMEVAWVSIDRRTEREDEARIYTQWNTAQPLRKWNFAICSNMDGHCA